MNETLRPRRKQERDDLVDFLAESFDVIGDGAKELIDLRVAKDSADEMSQTLKEFARTLGMGSDEE